MIKKINKILVISLQGIGDLLLTTPLLRELKENLPEAKISVLTFKTNKGILVGNSFVDEIFCLDPKNYIKGLVLLFTIRKKRFDSSICTFPSGLRSALLGYLSGAHIRLGQDLSIFNKYRWFFTKQVPITEVKHAVLLNLDFLKPLGINTENINTKSPLNLLNEDKNYAQDFLKANSLNNEDLLIAIHPGGGKFTAAYRSWPKERFTSAADLLIEKFGAKILFIGGENDEELIEEILSIMKHKAISAAGKTSLKQTAALIAESRLLICNNSAPMHIAAALNIPTIGIFGPADPRIHRPWKNRHIVLRKNLGCSPCYYPFFRDTLEETRERNRWFGKTFKCINGNYECLSLISVDDVIEATRNILKES